MEKDTERPVVIVWTQAALELVCELWREHKTVREVTEKLNGHLLALGLLKTDGEKVTDITVASVSGKISRLREYGLSPASPIEEFAPVIASMVAAQKKRRRNAAAARAAKAVRTGSPSLPTYGGGMSGLPWARPEAVATTLEYARAICAGVDPNGAACNRPVSSAGGRCPRHALEQR